jgi:dolichol-phosphate mannosyltransferase
MNLSVVIPAHNEEGCIEGTVRGLTEVLSREAISHEIIVVNDASSDGTQTILDRLCDEFPTVRFIINSPLNGFGYAVKAGLDKAGGDAIAIVMADASDDPEDLIRFYSKLGEGYDCVFGTRWQKGGKVIDYPFLKKILNRMANRLIQSIMRVKYDDVTNAFKLYRKEVIEGVHPLISPHFNLTVEIPLKAIVRGYRYAVVPNSWTNRATGVSKLKIKEMGSRYLFILLYCLIEKWLSRKDYHRTTIERAKTEENPSSHPTLAATRDDV